MHDLRNLNAGVSREDITATYVMLLNFTDQGIKTVKDTAKRAETFKHMANKLGVTVKEILWTLGQYDVVAIAEAPDDLAITALGLSAGALGNVRTQTLRAFAEAEIKTVIAKMV